MKRFFFITVAALFLWAGHVVAQGQREKKLVKFQGISYLAGGQIHSGGIPIALLDSLIRLPLVAKDSLGVERPVSAFFFTYIESGLYEDSTGHPMVMSDYWGTPSEGGLIPADWLKLLQLRMKVGDTVLYNQIVSMTDTGKNARILHTEPIRLVIKP
jgi:hypothetical protein